MSDNVFCDYFGMYESNEFSCYDKDINCSNCDGVSWLMEWKGKLELKYGVELWLSVISFKLNKFMFDVM